MSEEKSILLRAEEIVNGDRAKDYGDPFENWSTTVSIFKSMTGVDLTPAQGVQFAMAMKLARLRNSPEHKDTILDLAGYAWVYDQVRKGPKFSLAVKEKNTPQEFVAGMLVRRTSYCNTNIPEGTLGRVTGVQKNSVAILWENEPHAVLYPLSAAHLCLDTRMVQP